MFPVAGAGRCASLLGARHRVLHVLCRMSDRRSRYIRAAVGRRRHLRNSHPRRSCGLHRQCGASCRQPESCAWSSWTSARAMRRWCRFLRAAPFWWTRAALRVQGFDTANGCLSALRAFGVRTLSTLVVTHGNPDHIGGAPSALRRFGPRVLWEGVRSRLTSSCANWRPAAIDAPARFCVSCRPEIASGTDRMEIRVLHPPPPDWERQRVRNEDSVVLELRIGAVSCAAWGHRRGSGARHRQRPGTWPDCRHQGPASWQLDLQHRPVRGGEPSCRRGLQRRARQPVRPPGPDCRGPLSRRRRAGLQDG